MTQDTRADNALSTCPPEEVLHRYLDRELSKAEQETFAAHLRQCPTCQTEIAGLETLFAELSSLEDVPAVDVVAHVMDALPRIETNKQQAALSRLIIAGQIIVGLAIILTAWPIVTSSLDMSLVQLPLLTITDIALSFNNWLAELITGLSHQLSRQWPPQTGFSGFDISPAIIILLVVGLGLGWLIGNGLLLRQNSSSLKNGGTS